jgi:hypothetical protein
MPSDRPLRAAKEVPMSSPASLRKSLTLAAWVLAALTPTAAMSSSTATLVGRNSVNYLYYFGGFAISSDEGEAGAPEPVPGGAWEGVVVTDFAPHTLTTTGSDYQPLEYLFWSGFLSEIWDQTQTYGFGNQGSDAVMSIDGASSMLQESIVCSDATGCNLASELHRMTNTVALQFELDATTPYSLVGETRGGQWVDLLRWDTVALRWTPIVYGGTLTIDRSFSLDGSLAAGLYMLRNNPYTFSSGGTRDVNNAWTASLTLVGAVAAVPEPHAVALALAGLAVLVGARRRPWRRDAP